MGFFDWLKRPPGNADELPDSIWLTHQAKLAGVIQAVEALLGASTGRASVFLVAHFDDCQRELEQLAQAAGLEAPSLLVAKAENLRPRVAAAAGLNESHQVVIVVAQRHFLRRHDEAIVEFARGLPCKSRVVFHVSLEDPLMRLFAGDWLLNTLRRLGAKEDEAIQSNLVARRVKAAQKRLAARVSSDLPAISAEEWIKLNYSSEA
jgi:hypothetical protein